MKRFLLIMVATGLLLIPFAGLGQAQQAPPPVAQALVREGEFALKLADRLKIASPGSEADAESALASAGIAPSNGWIADYPITPDIAGELQDAITQAADSGRLVLSRDEALMAFQGLCAEMGLSVVADTSGEVVQNYPPPDYGQNSNPDVINNYYYDQGPPVVTYYPPPWDYYSMYAWVPYPFWCSGFWFSGFFILNDFHRPIYGHGGSYFVSNHFRDYQNHRVYTVDPVTRHNGRGFRGEGDLSHGRGFRSTEARNGAASIYGRNYGRSGPGNASNGGNSTRPGSGFQAGYSAKRGNSPPFSNSPARGSEKPSASWGNRHEATPRSSGERPSSQQRTFEGPSRVPSVGNNRSFSPPSAGVSRPSSSLFLGSRGSSGDSFRAPSIGSSRSFTAPSTGSRGSYRSSSRTPSVGNNRSFSSPSADISRSFASPSLGSRGSSGGSFRAPSVGSSRSFTAPSTGSRGSYGSSSRTPSVGNNRAFSSPSAGISRSFASPSLGSRSSSGGSFRSPSVGSSRSFTAPSTGSRGSYGSSSRTPQGGGHSGGLGRGGFSMR